jgi:hypothetical protein
VRSAWEHDFKDGCFKNAHWCRIHQVRVQVDGEFTSCRYPVRFNVISSRFGWRLIEVHCGPGAYLPKRPALATHAWQEYNIYGNTCHHPGCRLTEEEHTL